MRPDLGVPVYQTFNTSLGTFYRPITPETHPNIAASHVLHSLAPADLAAMRERIAIALAAPGDDGFESLLDAAEDVMAAIGLVGGS